MNKKVSEMFDRQLDFIYGNEKARLESEAAQSKDLTANKPEDTAIRRRSTKMSSTNKKSTIPSTSELRRPRRIQKLDPIVVREAEFVSNEMELNGIAHVEILAANPNLLKSFVVVHTRSVSNWYWPFKHPLSNSAIDHYHNIKYPVPDFEEVLTSEDFCGFSIDKVKQMKNFLIELAIDLRIKGQLRAYGETEDDRSNTLPEWTQLDVDSMYLLKTKFQECWKSECQAYPWLAGDFTKDTYIEADKTFKVPSKRRKSEKGHKSRKLHKKERLSNSAMASTSEMPSNSIEVSNTVDVPQTAEVSNKIDMSNAVEETNLAEKFNPRGISNLTKVSNSPEVSNTADVSDRVPISNPIETSPTLVIEEQMAPDPKSIEDCDKSSLVAIDNTEASISYIGPSMNDDDRDNYDSDAIMFRDRSTSNSPPIDNRQEPVSYMRTSSMQQDFMDSD